MNDELFDVCDEQDNVLRQATRSQVHANNWIHLRQATRSQVHANNWIHRAVHIWVFRSDGSLLLHRRSATKDTCPLKITSSASGHVDAGEDYHACAVRELREELGLSADLEELTKLPPGPLTAWEHSMFYRCTTDAEPVPDPEEIAEVMCHPLDEWQRRIDRTPLDFAPVFLELWEWYRSNVTG